MEVLQVAYIALPSKWKQEDIGICGEVLEHFCVHPLGICLFILNPERERGERESVRKL